MSPFVRRGLVAPVLAALVTAAAPTVASACSCGEPDPQAIVAGAALVFDGTVIDQKIGADPAGRRAAVIRVRVEAVVKAGRPLPDVVTLYSAPDPAMCGVVYPPNFHGRFGASNDAGTLYTDNCTHFGLNLEYFRKPR